MPQFEHYIGIDYSGAGKPTDGLTGIRVYFADDRGEEPIEITPQSGARHWCRRDLCAWIIDHLVHNPPTIVGIDHGFSFPWRFFLEHDLRPEWRGFLRDFRQHWPTHQPATRVEDGRRGTAGHGAARGGIARWRRVAEQRGHGAKSVFHFDVPGSVAKSTHAGLPWLLDISNTVPATTHFWPFDGWLPRSDDHVIAEVYPSLWREGDSPGDRTPDQQDAYLTARWLQHTDLDEELPEYFDPKLTPQERELAEIEGWILGMR